MRRRVTVLVLCVCVCVSVIILASTSFVSTFQVGMYGFRLGFIRFSTCGFSIKPAVQKLWREKANILMSTSLP